jgi:hypothetical protein
MGALISLEENIEIVNTIDSRITAIEDLIQKIFELQKIQQRTIEDYQIEMQQIKQSIK